MFSGIIETIGEVIKVEKNTSNFNINISSKFSSELSVGESVAHNGVCLTVTEIKGDKYKVNCVKETLNKTNLGKLQVGDKINLERSLMVNSRISGHFVQGHVDCTTKITDIQMADKSAIFSFILPELHQKYIVEKGSICLDGISLTVASKMKNDFTVAIIPHTIENTNWNQSSVGDFVNLEVDIISKYVENLMDKR